jgi:hypothetical protein
MKNVVLSSMYGILNHYLDDVRLQSVNKLLN